MNNDDTEPMLRRTMTSRRVVSLRERLLRAGVTVAYLAPQDVNNPSYFDDHVDAAVRAFQQERGLIVDGLVGPETDRCLNEAQYALGDRPLYADDRPLRGDDVNMLQHNLSRLGFYYGPLNGVFGSSTHHAVMELQQSLGLATTGVVDRETIAALARINKNITSSKAFSLREYHRLERATSALRGRSVVLVPSGAAGQQPPAAAAPDFRDRADEVTCDVALRAFELLHEIGAEPAVVSPGRELRDRLGGPVRTVDSAQEVVSGGRTDSVVVTLHCDWNSAPAAGGVASYYWGEQDRSEIYSPIGERAAVVVLKEMVARTGALDLGTHARQWDLLRSHDAPTIWLDLGYLSSPADRAALADPEHRNHLAEAVVFGLQRMFLLAEDDVPTGTMSVDDVAEYNGR